MSPDRTEGRQWLRLLADEGRPHVLQKIEPSLGAWSSLWLERPDATIRFDLTPSGSGSDLRWTLLVEEPVPDEPLLGHLRKRVNELINADLRLSFGQ